MKRGDHMLVAGLGQCSWDTLFFVDSYPPVDSKQEISGVIEQGGGPVATALVALRRMGISTRFSGIAGDDVAGRKIEDSLNTEGVDTSGLISRKGCASQMAFIAVERGTARRTIFWQRPKGGTISPDELDHGFLKGASLLMLDGLMPEASIHLARRARDLGIPVLLDAGRLREGMLELAALSDHVVGSEGFGLELGMDPENPEEFRQQGIELFPRGLTVTLGENGCVHFGADCYHHLGAYEVDSVDTTGAGDVFHAGFAYGLLYGFDIMRTLRFASAAAALSTRALGGRAALAPVEEIEAMAEAG
jgi:ribokinase